MRCSVTRPSLRYDTRCLIALFLGSAGGLVDSHAEAEAHRRQDLLDFVQALAAEVLGLEHFGFGLLHQLADRANVRVLEAVVGADRKLELLDALVEVFVARSEEHTSELQSLR